MKDLGIFDSILITNKFTGGGGINANEVIPRLAKKFNIIYFPRINDLIAYIKKNENALNIITKNIEYMEQMNIKVSDCFKNFIKKWDLNSTRNKLLKCYQTETTNVSLLYDNDYAPTIYPWDLGDIFYCSSKKNIPVSISLRGFSDINHHNNVMLIKNMIKNFNIFLNRDFVTKIFSFYLHPSFNNFVIKKFIKNINIKQIGLVNKSIEYYVPKLDKVRDKLFLLYPGDAVRFKKVFNNVKEDYLLFFARLVPEKGLYEIPLIAKELKNKNININIKIVGKFFYNFEEEIFFKLVQKLSVVDMIDYLGFLNEADLVNVIQKAKILIYPTHSDAYSIVMLEAIALNTQIITYDLYALTNLYHNLPSITFIKEYDIKSFTNAILQILNEDNKTYLSKFNNSSTKNFVNTHSNYDNVFDNLYKMIRTSIN